MKSSHVEVLRFHRTKAKRNRLSVIWIPSDSDMMDGGSFSKDISGPVFQSLGLRPNHASSALRAYVWGSFRAHVALNPR